MKKSGFPYTLGIKIHFLRSLEQAAKFGRSMQFFTFKDFVKIRRGINCESYFLG